MQKRSFVLVALTLSVLGLLQWGCGKSSEDFFATGKQSVEALKITLPDEHSSELSALEDLAEGTYQVFEVRTDVQMKSAGGDYSAGFRHQMKTPGSPENGDDVAYGFEGTAPDGKIAQIAPELSLPLSISVNSRGVWANDIRYYWNRVKSNGG